MNDLTYRCGAPGRTRTCDLRFRNTSTLSAGINWEQQSPIVIASSSTENDWCPQVPSRSCAQNVHECGVSNSRPLWCRVRGKAVATSGVLEPEISLSDFGGCSNYCRPKRGLSANRRSGPRAQKPLPHKDFVGVWAYPSAIAGHLPSTCKEFTSEYRAGSNYQPAGATRA